MEGAFVHTVAVPVDVADGAYVVEAESGEHVVWGPPMFIGGTPLTPHDQGTRFDEGDSLLAPMPTPSAQAAAAAPVEQLPAPPGDDRSSESTVGIAVAGGLIVVAFAAWAVERRRRTRRLAVIAGDVVPEGVQGPGWG